MIVLYLVLVLSIIAGNGLISADDTTAAPSTPAANAAPAPSAAPDPNAAPAQPAAPSANAAPAPPEANAAPVNVTAARGIPESENAAGTGNLASTLERITNFVEAHPSRVAGPGAIPLLPGKNYDFFLLKVPKNQGHSGSPPKSGRNLENNDNGNDKSAPDNVDYNVQPAQHVEPQPCLCQPPPPQVAPNLNTLQGIYGNALRINAIIDPNCRVGMVPYYPNPSRMMPAIDGIPVTEFNALGMDFNDLGPAYPDQNNYLNFPQQASFYPGQSPAGQYPQVGGESGLPFNGYNPMATQQLYGASQYPQMVGQSSLPGSSPYTDYNPLAAVQPYGGSQYPQNAGQSGLSGASPYLGYNPLTLQQPYGSSQYPQIGSQLGYPGSAPSNGFNPLATQQLYKTEGQDVPIGNPFTFGGIYPPNGYNPEAQHYQPYQSYDPYTRKEYQPFNVPLSDQLPSFESTLSKKRDNMKSSKSL